MKIIGISGKMGSGKNYLAEKILYPYFKNKYNILIIGFGDLMKNELFARDLTLMYDDLYDKKTFETRNKLQQYGTENGRNKYHKNIWIRGLDIQIETFSRRSGKDTLIIICDVRFKNEYDYIINKGGKVVRIEAPERTLKRYLNEVNNNFDKYNIIKNHISEIELDNHKFNYIINNDKPLNIDFNLFI
jgi:hypothetical protein